MGDMEYNLEKRTLKFSKDILVFLLKLKNNPVNTFMISQLVRSATSIGANYREANAASSKKDFKNKIFISRKETNESKYWIELLGNIELDKKEDLRKFWKEAHELSLIFGKIFHSLNKQINQN